MLKQKDERFILIETLPSNNLEYFNVSHKRITKLD